MLYHSFLLSINTHRCHSSRQSVYPRPQSGLQSGEDPELRSGPHPLLPLRRRCRRGEWMEGKRAHSPGDGGSRRTVPIHCRVSPPRTHLSHRHAVRSLLQSEAQRFEINALNFLSFCPGFFYSTCGQLPKVHFGRNQGKFVLTNLTKILFCSM